MLQHLLPVVVVATAVIVAVLLFIIEGFDYTIRFATSIDADRSIKYQTNSKKHHHYHDNRRRRRRRYRKQYSLIAAHKHHQQRQQRQQQGDYSTTLATTTIDKDSSETTIATEWTACWAHSVFYPQYGCTSTASNSNSRNEEVLPVEETKNRSSYHHQHHPQQHQRPLLFRVSQIPTTAMMVLIDNGYYNHTSANTTAAAATTRLPTTKTDSRSLNGTITSTTSYDTHFSLEYDATDTATSSPTAATTPASTPSSFIYTSQNLQYLVPDMQHLQSRQYYTLLYQTTLPIQQYNNKSGNDKQSMKVFVQFAGIHYNATVWYNGIQLPNIQYQYFHSRRRCSNTTVPNCDRTGANTRQSYPGAFVRHLYDLTSTYQHDDSIQNYTSNNQHHGFIQNNLLVIQIDPPFHPGNNSLQQPQQGGSHDLAKDGAVIQYMLGWDWCRTMPDRATGFYGGISLLIFDYEDDEAVDNSTFEQISKHKQHSEPNRDDNNQPFEFGNLDTTTTTELKSELESDDRTSSITCTVHDPGIQTVQISNCTWITATNVDESHELKYICSDITLQLLVHVECDTATTFDIEIILESDWGEKWMIPYPNYVDDRDYFDVQETLFVDFPDKVRVWWPHGMGIQNYAHRHNFTMTLVTNGMQTDTITLPVGIRLIETFIDPIIQGQRFRINHHDMYIVGGNWIGTDQALRYSASKERYCNEVLLHQYAGLNLIRVWGGGTTERDEFYDCTDQYGILVYQEFWMTGDNNGRWAGNYSWPHDYDAYLVNVEDTIKRLRHHPSLLFYGGCNECLAPKSSSWAPNPPLYVDDGIRTLVNMFDPGRFYISSSMGGPSKGDTFYEPSMYENRSYSLAYGDGPYGMLLPSTFFDRNPGLECKNVSIGFQPEIGSVSVPTYNGMLKFMSKDEVHTGFPRRHACAVVGDSWSFHNFLPWTTTMPNNETYDHVYAYFRPDYDVDAIDWISAAQLAARVQYQHLFNGYLARMFNYTTAVIMWKTQSPWPSLRGFLYDWYLESTGALNGVRSSLRFPVSIVFDMQSWKLILVNRQVFPVSPATVNAIGATYTWINIHGEIILSSTLYLKSKIVPAMEYRALGDVNEGLYWPKQCTDVCFLRITGTHDRDAETSTSWYWLTNPELGDASDYSLLGDIRKLKINSFQWEIIQCIERDNKLYIELTLSLQSKSSYALLYPTFSVFRQSDGIQILPIFDQNDVDQMIILPGTSHQRVLESSIYTKIRDGETFIIKMTSWNAPDDSRSCSCRFGKESGQ